MNKSKSILYRSEGDPSSSSPGDGAPGKEGVRSAPKKGGVGSAQTKRKGSPTKEDLLNEELKIKGDPFSYATNGMCQDLHVAQRIFEQVQGRIPREFSPKSVLDYGCGTGGVLWAVMGHYDHVQQYMGVDNKNDLLSAARSLCSGFHMRTRWGQAPPKGFTYDIVISVDHLSTLSPSARRTALQKMWEASNGLFIVAEHGKRSFSAVNQAREFVLKKIRQQERLNEKRMRNGNEESLVFVPRIVAPCPHQSQCPMQTEKYGCHFGIRVPQIDFPLFSEQKEIKCSPRFGQNILGKFSYVAVWTGGHVSSSTSSSTSPMESEEGSVAAGDTSQAKMDGKEEEKDENDHHHRLEREDDGGDEDAAAADDDADDATAVCVSDVSLSPPASSSVVVAPPLKRGKHVVLEVCTCEGAYIRATIGRANKDEYKAAREASWGDAWPFGSPKKGILKSISGVEIASMPSRRKNKSKSSAGGEHHDLTMIGGGLAAEEEEGGFGRIAQKKASKSGRSSGREGPGAPGEDEDYVHAPGVPTPIQFGVKGRRSRVKLIRDGTIQGEREAVSPFSNRGKKKSAKGHRAEGVWDDGDDDVFGEELFDQGHQMVDPGDEDYELVEAVRELESLREDYSKHDGDWESDDDDHRRPSGSGSGGGRRNRRR